VIKAIETKYKGYRFRSRLEARWAVFFDFLGIEWDYEPEGFDLGEGVFYLPDFRLKGLDTNGDEIDFWVEIKPSSKSVSDEEKEKIEKFSECFVSSFYGGFLLCEGMPGEKFAQTEVTQGFDILMWSHRKRPWLVIGCSAEEECRSMPSAYHLTKSNALWKRDYLSACTAARSARFEHGESP